MSAIAVATELAALIPIVLAATVAYAWGRSRAPHAGNALERDLMRRRRREEPAAMLVVEGSYAASAGSALAASLRLTDTVEWKIRRGRVEMRAILDEEALDRATVERRLAEASGGELHVGWATFPEDGFTVHTLEQVARKRLSPISDPVGAAHPVSRPALLTTVEQATGS